MKYNICADTDFYKMTHWKQYPEGLTSIYSYCESRNGAEFPSTVFAGLVPVLKDFLVGQVVSREKIEEAEEVTYSMGGYKSYFNRDMWEHILNKHGGHLPIKIKALPEGTVVPPSVPLFTIESLDERCVPIVNHCETLLMHVWGATTVASASRYIKEYQLDFAKKTGTPELIPFMLHDFGFRGVSSWMSALYLGMAHLINYDGTDTNVASRGIKHYYDDNKYYGKSVWATEHSVATSFGPGAGEVNYVRHQLNNSPDDSIVSLVGDSYDIFNFAKKVIGDACKEQIVNRAGRVVVRPDSGDPLMVIPKLLDILSSKFGFTVNEKGYKVIHNNVGLLQGDGMDYKTIKDLYTHITSLGWSSDNLVVGSGGGLLQKWNRDTQRFAIKASHGVLNGKEFDIYKDPVTANSGSDTKVSKRGRLKVQRTPTGKCTILKSSDPGFESYHDDLQTVFENGELIGSHSFADIRERAKIIV
jgi:nicotinamide phosphoribosyltransferase